MQQRFFFYRIDMHRTRVAVGNRIKFSFDVHLGAAAPTPSRNYHAFVRTGFTLDGAIGKRPVKVGFLYVGIGWRKTLLCPGGTRRHEQAAAGCIKSSLQEIPAGCFHFITFNPRLIAFKTRTVIKTPNIPILGRKRSPVNIVPQPAPARSAR